MNSNSILRFALLGAAAMTFLACAEDDEEMMDGSGEGSGMETAGEFQIRVTHLSGDAPAIDVYAGDAATPSVPGLTFGDGTGYLTLPAGVDYTFNVRVAGSDPTSDPVLVQEASPLDGDVLNVLAIGRLGGVPEPLETTVIVEDLTAPMEGMIRVQAVHAAPSAGEVDIYNIPTEGDPVQLVPDLAYGTASGYLEVPAGSYQLGIDINNDPGTLELVFSTSPIETGAILNLIAINNEAGDAVRLLIQDANGNEINLAADGAN
jgi:hypothetical protein